MKALITGASSGLGRAFALWLSKHNYEVVLVARNQTSLLELQSLLPNKSEIIIADLTVASDLERICLYIEENRIDFLINNAGTGVYGSYWLNDYQETTSMYLLNIVAPSLLIQRYLARYDEGRILNVSSIAACQVDPLMAGYGASKTFLLQISKSINIELQHSHKKIILQTCLPGSFVSNFDHKINISFSKAKITSEEMVNMIMKEVFKNKKIIVPGMMNKWAYRIGFLIPEKIMAKIEYNIQKSKKNGRI